MPSSNFCHSRNSAARLLSASACWFGIGGFLFAYVSNLGVDTSSVLRRRALFVIGFICFDDVAGYSAPACLHVRCELRVVHDARILAEPCFTHPTVVANFAKIGHSQNAKAMITARTAKSASSGRSISSPVPVARIIASQRRFASSSLVIGISTWLRTRARLPRRSIRSVRVRAHETPGAHRNAASRA